MVILFFHVCINKIRIVVVVEATEKLRKFNKTRIEDEWGWGRGAHGRKRDKGLRSSGDITSMSGYEVMQLFFFRKTIFHKNLKDFLFIFFSWICSTSVFVFLQI